MAHTGRLIESLTESVKRAELGCYGSGEPTADDHSGVIQAAIERTPTTKKGAAV